MKRSATETGSRLPSEEKTESKQVLRLKKRPLVSLTDDQMGDAAGGYPYTCDPTCPPTCGDGATCVPTCLPTCGNDCPHDPSEVTPTFCEGDNEC